MRIYFDLQHMEVVTAIERKKARINYLPYYAVRKRTDPKGKIHVVFNASYRMANGWSLNDILLAGSKLQNELWMVLSSWRLQ